MKIVLIAVNEDGYGPSSMLFHIVRAIIALLPDHAIILRTGTKALYNERLYADILSDRPAPGRVFVERMHNLIQVVNRGDGRTDAEASLESLSRYPILRERYLRCSLHGATFGIDIGVPTLARACFEARIPCFTIFDHSWAVTFRRIMRAYSSNLQSIESGFQPSAQLGNAFELLEADEASTAKVFLFDSPLTSPDYWNHWNGICPSRVASIGGILGGPPEGHERALRNEGRYILGLDQDDDRLALLVSAGGTGVWKERLLLLIEEFARLDAEKKLEMYVFILADLEEVEKSLSNRIQLGPRESRKFVDGRPAAICQPIADWKGNNVVKPKVWLLSSDLNCTYRQIVAGVHFVLTRAGVVTLMDAWATGACTLLVPQLGQPQVQEVHQAVVDQPFLPR